MENDEKRKTANQRLKEKTENKRKKEIQIKKLREDQQFQEKHQVFGWLRSTKQYVLLEKWEWIWNEKEEHYYWTRTFILKEAVNHCPNGCPTTTYFHSNGLCDCYCHESCLLDNSRLPLPKAVSLGVKQPTEEEFKTGSPEASLSRLNYRLSQSSK